MPDQPAQEPSMDEILASIRRIITDDEPGEEAKDESKTPQPAGAGGATPAKGKAEEPASANVAEASGGPAAKAETSKKAADEPAPVSEKDMAESKVGDAQAEDPQLVSDKAATDTASAFAKLSVAVKESSGEPSMTMPAPGRSLEDVVRELLRPILKEWLETHLPEIVREHVEEEVARISRGSRSR
jgi:cell pole-organizing protein PopZ